MGARSELIHDYFILKTLESVRPGGITALITSTGTLDKKDARIRQKIAESADLLGAVRLPRGTFSRTAQTDTSADILVLRKRVPGVEPGGIPFQDVVTVDAESDVVLKTEEGWIRPGDFIELPLNEVFANNPTWAGNRIRAVSGRFGPELAFATTDETGQPLQVMDQVRRLLGELDDALPDDLFITAEESAGTAKKEASAVGSTYEMRENRDVVVQGYYIGEDDSIRVVTHIALEVDPDSGDQSWRVHSAEVPVPASHVERVRSLLMLRDKASSHLKMESQLDIGAPELEDSRKELNSSYDDFVKRFGYINERANRKWALDDAAGSVLIGLELWDQAAKVATKADVFSQRVISPPNPVDNASSVREAAMLSMARRGSISVPEMARLLSSSEEEVLQHIESTNDLYFDAKGDRWVFREQYLSGNVRQRLSEATSAAQMNPTLERNVTALEGVIPSWVPFEDIHASMGATWIGPEYYRQFLTDLFNGSTEEQFTVEFVPLAGQWVVDVDAELKDRCRVDYFETYGTDRYPFHKVLEAALSNRSPVITDEYKEADGRTRRIKNAEESLQAQIKVDQLKEAFTNWLRGNSEVATELESIYNHRFNSFRFEEWDSQGFEFSGLSTLYEPRPHQSNSVFRALCEGNLLFAHCVGAGKTMEQAMLMVTGKQLGLMNKPVLAVPNHLLLQAGAAIKSYYPMANVLVVQKSDLSSPERRAAFTAKVALNDWDAIVMTVSMLPKIKMPVEFEKELIQERIEEYESMLWRLDEIKGTKKSQGAIYKGINKKVQAERERLKAFSKQRELDADQGLDISQLGIDCLLVDEAHLFKNLDLRTALSLPGISTGSGSQRAEDLFVKSRYLMELHGEERGLHFFTGTPIANSISELYVMHRYLRPSVYESADIWDFATWVSTFGEVERNLEILPEGSGFQMKERLATFHNLPELLFMFRTLADVKTRDDLNLPTPNVKQETIVAPKSHWLNAFMKELASRASAIRQRLVEPTDDNLLKVSTDGRKASLCMTLLDERIPLEQDDKLMLMVGNIQRLYQDYSSDKGTQLVFCDLGTPKTGERANEFTVYQAIKDALVEGGIPEAEVAFMQSAKTDAAKEIMQASVRSGEIRVLIGSTENMGTGVNVQDRLIGLHNLDCPWRPDQLEQRLGRIDRQGNMFSEVYCFNYTTEDSFDLFMWETLRRKARFIAQGMSDPASIGRSLEEDSDSFNYAEIVAITTGNPQIGRKVEVDAEVQKLERMEAMHKQRARRVERIVKEQEGEFRYHQANLEKNRSVASHVLDTIRNNGGREFALLLKGSIPGCQEGDTVWLSSSGGRAALETALSMSVSSNLPIYTERDVGSFNGLDLIAIKVNQKTGKLELFHNGERASSLSFEGPEVVLSPSRLSNWQSRLPAEIRADSERCKTLQASIESSKVGSGDDGEFGYQHKLDQLRVEQKRINEDLEREAAESGTGAEEFSFAQYVNDCLPESDTSMGSNNDLDEGEVSRQLGLAVSM